MPGASLINGLGGPAGFGEFGFAPNDDDSFANPFFHGEVGDDFYGLDIRNVFGPQGLNFFGTYYTRIYINNNGNVTFGDPLFEYVPSPIGTGIEVSIIAPFWYDVDTRLSGVPNTVAAHVPGVGNTSPGGTSTGSDLVWIDADTDSHILTVTWDDVGYFARHDDAVNAYQLRIIDLGNGDFEFDLIFEALNYSYGSSARSGFSPGSGDLEHSFELPGSGGEGSSEADAQPQLRLATMPGNTGEIGIWRFSTTGGFVRSGGDGGAPKPKVNISLDALVSNAEGDRDATPFVFTLHRSGASLDATSVVHWQVDGADPTDFVAGQAFEGDVTFAAGATDASVTLNVQGDRTFEPDDNFIFKATSGTFGDQTFTLDLRAAGVIRNDDAQVRLAGPVIRAEGKAGASTPFDFVVTRTGDTTRELTVQWQVDLQSAASNDFAAGQELTGTAIFGVGSSQALIHLLVAGDSTLESDETFGVRVTGVVNGGSVIPISGVQATGTILDDDFHSTMLIGAPPVLVAAEGSAGTKPYTFTVVRVGDASGAMSVPWTLLMGDTNAADFSGPTSGNINFAAGATQGTLTILVVGDTVAEAAETFMVSVGGSGSNTLTLVGVILNDDRGAITGAPAGFLLDGSNFDPAPPAPASDVSDFMHNLIGGWSWGDGLS